MENEILKEILVKGHYITEADFNAGVATSGTSRTSLLEYFFSEGILTKDIVGQAMAEYFKISYVDIAHNPPTREMLSHLTEDFARTYNTVIIKENEKSITLATSNPTDKQLLGDLKKLFPNKKITIAYALEEDISNLFTVYQKNLNERFKPLFDLKTGMASAVIDEIMQDALSARASDIHFEPAGKFVTLRFRIDGVLSSVAEIPKESYENILNRIKVDSRLRIDQHVNAQDGSMRYGTSEPFIDIRVSIVPTIEGEKCVMRILSHYVEDLTLSDIGLSKISEEKIRSAAEKPFGMVLVVGPTGAGKTTTLYSVLKRLNNPRVNITTIEDPVEYRIEGINQIQVNMDTHLTFADGLRSIVRQDPDIVLVGEIRDKETAEISVNAALTGHLLLSTFHANDASSAVPRLIEMGVEPFLLASTLEVIVAQRLVRKICSNCRYSKSVPVSEISKTIPNAKKYFKGSKTTLYTGRGCSSCGGSGYLGRIGVFEVIEVTPELEDLILKHPNAGDIWKISAKSGAVSLFEDGIEKVKNGITTIDELVRVVGLGVA